jgi:hypothetical protein
LSWKNSSVVANVAKSFAQSNLDNVAPSMMFIRHKPIVFNLFIWKIEMACIQEFCYEMVASQSTQVFNTINEVTYKGPFVKILFPRYVKFHVFNNKHKMWLKHIS